MLTGWRAWRMRRDGGLTRVFPQADPYVWDRGWALARCRRHPSPTPAPDCLCGLHVISSEAEMWEFVRARYRSGSAPDSSGGSAPCAVGLVEYEGAALKSLIPTDPPSTLRVERARIVGVAILLQGGEALAPPVQRRYGVRVIDQDLAELHLALYGTATAAAT